MWSLSIKTVKVFFQDQLAMARNRKAVNIHRIVNGIGSHNFLYQFSNRLFGDADLSK
jgi:hypothetical protein